MLWWRSGEIAAPCLSTFWENSWSLQLGGPWGQESYLQHQPLVRRCGLNLATAKFIIHKKNCKYMQVCKCIAIYEWQIVGKNA